MIDITGRHPFQMPNPLVELRDEPFIVAPPYISIDLETTGLDHNWCQILEVGAVIDNWKWALDDLPRFHCYVIHDRVVGEAKGLAMNAKILDRIAERARPENREYLFLMPSQVMHNLKIFLRDNGMGSDVQTVAAGKNFARFDDRFLEKLDGYRGLNLLHRCIDPGMFYWDPTRDRQPPNTEECLRRAGLPADVKHDAINDALNVIRLIRTDIGIRF